MLGALARDAIVLADRQRELAVVRAAHEAIERKQILHGTLAERLLADDDAAIVVLNRRREDFRCAGAVAIDEDRQRAVVDRGGARVVELLDRAARLAQLHDRSALDEQPGKLRSLREVPAAVGAQVHDEAVDAALGPELRDETRDVA